MSALPLWSEEEFVAALQELARENAPRVFALCEEIGDRQDGHVEYWGMAFDDGADVVSASGQLRASFKSAEAALDRLSRRSNLHLVWG
ncbi:hypothetical protein SAMN05421805_11442 [Saccharopolyspora antimicrobica]|uniref:Uncharacterized protein n=1 Tax=Saccharopolyspora antimicrobica TaxID=455193 RepID=A0A1I5GZK8_9PSEU|nr:hypothetical protein [Saccharopolyspora antimicrobica]RKT89291.1 hypothetical protein ATL45_7746 [Saccharopolyspora antimicrobica]RKT89293.1 hypothetical protein ATL45_7749 [Saccharopolyspora antimicrobica]RKT90044.1 hypothetical protein ATL45_0007 [Saccharopolyspora antimicrobica]SFO41395.1 hypothetical protein SAMN05421805_11442 [Saccharopolyspora antimicrobica]